MMRKFLIPLLLLFLSVPALAQDPASASFGLDPENDDRALKELQAYMDSIRVHRPTVALVLSGGGAKGAAHTGVLSYIEKLDIPVDIVLGTSMGGLIGGLYSVGYTADQLDTLLREADWDLLLSDRIGREYISFNEADYKRRFGISFPFFYRTTDLRQLDSLDIDLSDNGGGRLDLSENGASFKRRNVLNSLPSGMYNGYNVCNLLSSLTVGYQDDDLRFQDLPIPFLCVATDVVSAKAKVWHEGRLTTALRSTMSIPGLFKAVRVGNMVLLDGGMRNNYPTDIARQIGADIIIGVELSDAIKGADEIYNLGDIVYKGIDMLSNDSFERSLSIPDVTIKPNLAGYDMLSFDRDAIDTIIRRGYAAAAEKEDSLRLIKERVGSDGFRLRGAPAVDLSRSSIRIDTILVSGVSASDASYIYRRIAYLRERECDKALIEDAVSRIFATRAYEYVNYDLLGTENPYTLRIRCRKAPINRIGLSARVDTEELVSVLFNLGFGVNKLSGQKLDLTARIGTNPSGTVLYSYDAPGMPTLNLQADYRLNLRNRVLIGEDPYFFSAWNLSQQFYLSNLDWSTLDLRLGVKNEILRARNLVPDEELPAPVLPDRKTRDNLSFLFRFRANTFDKAYFPTTGFSLSIDIDHVLTVSDGTVPNFTTLSAGWRQIFPMGEKWALLPAMYFRMAIGDDIPIQYRNFLGGEFGGRYLEQQIPFAGMAYMALRDNYLGVVCTGLRYALSKNSFLTGSLNGSFDFSDLDTIRNGHSLVGAAFGYGFDSMFGPIKAMATWDSLTMAPGIYLSMGYEF